MKKLIEAIVKFLNSKLEQKVKEIEQPKCRIYMPGEPLPYNEDEIEDVECEIIK